MSETRFPAARAMFEQGGWLSVAFIATGLLIPVVFAIGLAEPHRSQTMLLFGVMATISVPVFLVGFLYGALWHAYATEASEVTGR